jgi:hypothetical protein
MTNSGKAFTDQHDIDQIDENEELVENNGDPVTPQSIEDAETEVGSNQVDDMPDLIEEAIKQEDKQESK